MTRSAARAIKSILLIGQTNVGKTLFMINFSAYLQLSKLDIEISDNGLIRRKSLTINQARRLLVHHEPHTTRQIQSVTVQIPARKGRKTVRIVDSTGLVAGIHQVAEVRHGMAETLRYVPQAGIVLHMFDAAEIGLLSGGEDGQYVSEMDLHIANFLQSRKIYAVLANKMDRAESASGLKRIRKAFPHHRVIPISALRSQGFREVKSFVWDHL